jgi:hypothetical protein
MAERHLEAELVAGFNKTVWGAVAGYALFVIVVFGAVSELGLRRSLENTAAVIESLLGLYADPTGEPTTVAPAMLADQLVGMEHAFAITREAGDEHMRELYFLSPDMPAKRIEGMGPATPETMRELLLAEISESGGTSCSTACRGASIFMWWRAGSPSPQGCCCCSGPPPCWCQQRHCSRAGPPASRFETPSPPPDRPQVGSRRPLPPTECGCGHAGHRSGRVGSACGSTYWSDRGDGACRDH